MKPLLQLSLPGERRLARVRLLVLSGVACALALTVYAQTTLSIANRTYVSGEAVNLSGTPSIVAQTNTAVASGAKVYYRVSASGASITLGDGFTAAAGLEPCRANQSTVRTSVPIR